MSTGASGFPTEVLLIPLILLVTIGGLYLLGQIIKARVESEMKHISAETRRLDTERRQLEATLQAFEDAQSEPFGSRVKALRKLLDDAGWLSKNLQTERVQIRQKAGNLSAANWPALMAGAFMWFGVQQDVKRLLAGMSGVEQTLQAARQKEQEIQRLGWEIAQQARQARQLQRQVRRALEPLEARRMEGKAFKDVLEAEAGIRSRLDTIPEYLFSDDEERVLALLDRETTTAAHAAVEAARPALETLLAQAQSWGKQAGRADELVGRLRRLLEDVEQTLVSLPVAVDGGGARAQLGQMQQIARSLETTLTRLEVESIDEVVQEAERQARLAQELSQALKRARREAPALQTTLESLSAGLKEIFVQTGVLSKTPRHPLRWRDSTDTLADLKRDLSRLGGPDRPRPPEQLQKDLEAAAGLRARQTELAGRVRQVQEDHAKLLGQLDGFAGFESWLEDARRVAEKAAGYAPENWSRQEAVDRLPADLNALADEARRLEIFKPETRLDEDQVAQRLTDALALAGAYQAQQRRVDLVRARLDELARQEQETGEILEKLRAALGQVEYVVNSNDFLGGIAAQDLEHFAAELKRLGEESADRRRGRVDARLRQAAALAQRIEAGANRWLEQLIAEIEAQNEDLGALLKELDEIAALDEQPIADARRLLSSAGGLGRGSFAGRGPLELEALIPELKRRSDYWHSANAAMHAMQDFHPLIETYGEALYQREQTHRALAEAGSGMRQRRAWPPTTVSLDGERQELEKIEAQWQELQNGHAKAIARTAQLGGLAARYGALTERIAQAAERAAREGSEVEDLEAELSELAELWRNHLYDLQEYPEASAEIQGLLEDLSREVGQVRRRYQQGGSDYNAVVQALRTLTRRVRYFQIALDDERALDVQGKIHFRREGKNVRGKF